MGFFSFKTQDTDRSIPNVHSGKPTFKVHMIDKEKNVWTEESYDGYGVFGGKDFFELVAEMNGLTATEEQIKAHPYGKTDAQKYTDIMRGIGIDIYHNWEPGTFYSPTLAEKKDCEWIGTPPKGCEYQGYFYGGAFEFLEEL